MKISWREIGEIVALVSVVVSLLFVGYELRMSRQLAINESSSAAAATSPEVIGLIAAHPSIWMRGCIGEDLTRDEEMIFGGLVQALDRQFFYRYRIARDGISGINPVLPAIDMARTRVLYPGIDRKSREIYGTNPDGSERYRILVEEQYELLKDTYSSVTADATVCGLYGL